MATAVTEEIVAEVVAVAREEVLEVASPTSHHPTPQEVIFLGLVVVVEAPILAPMDSEVAVVEAAEVLIAVEEAIEVEEATVVEEEGAVAAHSTNHLRQWTCRSRN